MILPQRSSSREINYRRYDGSQRREGMSGYHRSRHYSRRSRRSRFESSDRYRYRSVSRSPDCGRNRHRKSPTSRTRIRVDSPEPSRCLGVFGLSIYTTEPYLMQTFCKYGMVEKVTLINDANTKLSRGFGFVYFKTVAEASLARLSCNGLELHGRRMRVDFSITEMPHPPTPGVYKGRKEDGGPSSPRENSRHDHRRHHHRRSESRTRI